MIVNALKEIKELKEVIFQLIAEQERIKTNVFEKSGVVGWNSNDYNIKSFYVSGNISRIVVANNDGREKEIFIENAEWFKEFPELMTSLYYINTIIFYIRTQELSFIDNIIKKSKKDIDNYEIERVHCNGEYFKVEVEVKNKGKKDILIKPEKVLKWLNKAVLNDM